MGRVRDRIEITAFKDVGEQILITVRNPWWKFWLPREQQEWATVTKVWMDWGSTRVAATTKEVVRE